MVMLSVALLFGFWFVTALLFNGHSIGSGFTKFCFQNDQLFV